MADYSAVDAAIIAALHSSPGMMGGSILCRVRDHAEVARTGNQCAMRLVDARLQSLKRRGVLTFLKKPRGWFVTPELK